MLSVYKIFNENHIRFTKPRAYYVTIQKMEIAGKLNVTSQHMETLMIRFPGGGRILISIFQTITKGVVNIRGGPRTYSLIGLT